MVLFSDMKGFIFFQRILTLFYTRYRIIINLRTSIGSHYMVLGQVFRTTLRHNLCNSHSECSTKPYLRYLGK